jgi:MFS family permease
MTAIAAARPNEAPRVGVGKIGLASLVGTTIEFYDFYIFGTAAALVFGPMFFPKSAPETQTLNAYLTFGLAFLARPVGSFLFGHFGDRIGRKSTLVATMLTTGLATTLIGVLPSYTSAGVFAPWALAALRFVQGVGLGGEWGGAALIAVEDAPEGKRAWYGMFPQLGPPIGFLIATDSFSCCSSRSARRPLSTGRGGRRSFLAPCWWRLDSMCVSRSKRPRRSKPLSKTSVSLCRLQRSSAITCRR